jgi:hypothetical protein
MSDRKISGNSVSHFTLRMPEAAVACSLVAHPGGQMLVGLPGEQNFAVGGIKRIRRQQQNGFLLVNAGQIKQVGVLEVAHGTVGIGGHEVVGVENCQRAGGKFLDESFAVEGEQGGWQRHDFHTRTVYAGTIPLPTQNCKAARAHLKGVLPAGFNYPLV